MVGYAYRYSQADWAKDIALASSAGIDAFALNIFWYPDFAPNQTLPYSAQWQIARLQDAYAAAAASPTNFRMFLSIDASSQFTPIVMAAYVNTLGVLPGQFMVDNKPFVSTFAGEALTYGQANRSAGWQYALRNQVNFPIYFSPFWSSLGPESMEETVVDGVGNWNAWPIGDSDMNTGFDQLYMYQARRLNKTYIAAVSPMFYAHFDGWNIITRGDNDLYGTRWQQLATMDTPPDFVEIVTWVRSSCALR